MTTEVFPSADLMSYYATKSEKILRDERFTLAVFRNTRSMIVSRSRSEGCVISPWIFLFYPTGSVVWLEGRNTVVPKAI